MINNILDLFSSEASEKIKEQVVFEEIDTPVQIGELQHFKDSEFRCKCGCGVGKDDMDPRLLLMLDNIRETINMPMKINSAARCASHNRAVGGTEKSEHVPSNTDTGLCTGVDVHIPNSMFLYKLVKELYKYDVPRIGLNQAKNFVHIGLSKNHPQDVFFKY